MVPFFSYVKFDPFFDTLEISDISGTLTELEDER